MSNKITIFRQLKTTAELQMLTFDNYDELQEFKRKFHERQQLYQHVNFHDLKIRYTNKNLDDIFTEWNWASAVSKEYTIDGKKYGDVENE